MSQSPWNNDELQHTADLFNKSIGSNQFFKHCQIWTRLGKVQIRFRLGLALGTNARALSSGSEEGSAPGSDQNSCRSKAPCGSPMQTIQWGIDALFLKIFIEGLQL